jgi:hypothetical protein
MAGTTLSWDDDTKDYGSALLTLAPSEDAPKACAIDEPECEACQ